MTNEEWIEELYMKAAEMGMYNFMHTKIDEVRAKHKDLTMIEAVELAFIELKRKYEEEQLQHE